MIEASFLQQYGIRLTTTDMPYAEFVRLLGGLMPETPLGRIVTIRAEKDSKVLKHFTPEQKKIRTEWMLYKNEILKSDVEAYNEKTDRLQATLSKVFGEKGGGGNV